MLSKGSQCLRFTKARTRPSSAISSPIYMRNGHVEVSVQAFLTGSLWILERCFWAWFIVRLIALLAA